MRIPMRGSRVRGSRSGAPIMALFDLLGRRWAMGIVWTLAETGPLTFGELQHRADHERAEARRVPRDDQEGHVPR